MERKNEDCENNQVDYPDCSQFYPQIAPVTFETILTPTIIMHIIHIQLF